jgi:hypothetical protein
VSPPGKKLPLPLSKGEADPDDHLNRVLPTVSFRIITFH